MIHLIVPVVPVAQPRAKASSFGGHTRVYTPTTIGKGDGKREHPIVQFKSDLKVFAKQAYTGPRLDGPLRVDVVFVFPRPASRIWKTKPMPREPHVVKPDRDNLDKAVLDSLTKVGIWRDDCQVCAGSIEKWIAAGDEQPHVEITIRQL